MDVLGPEPEEEAQPRTTLHVVRRLHANTDQKAYLQLADQTASTIRMRAPSLIIHTKMGR
jgi:hypothetical protein